jgi:Uma2 family endonuclease
LHSPRDDGIVVVEMGRSAMAPAPFLTTDEYLATPETSAPTEVIFGAMRVADAPAARHQQALCAFHLALGPHVRERRLGRVLLAPLDVILDWDRALILQPDLVFISHARWQTRRQKVVGPPDLVMEVLSPEPRIGALGERINWFLTYGVREVWLLHQFSERLDIVTSAGGTSIARQSYDYFTPLRSTVLPEFTATVADILRDA